MEIKYPNPIAITNFSIEANAYRNVYRKDIDTLFMRADKFANELKYSKELSKSDKQNINNKINQLRQSARYKWREIIDYSNKL